MENLECFLNVNEPKFSKKEKFETFLTFLRLCFVVQSVTERSDCQFYW